MLNEFSKECHSRAKNKGFYDCINYVLANKDENEKQFYKNLFVCQQLLLIITELGEATEALRQGDNVNFNEEIADTFIRLFDLSGYLELDVDSEISKKLKVNEQRPYLHKKSF